MGERQVLKSNLCRLAKFGANISDAYGCFIFLPGSMISEDENTIRNNNSNNLELAGYHSLSTDVISDCKIPSGGGLIGWVAKHRRSIHVSPFERDSRTLGIYNVDQKLKSFIGVPIALPAFTEKSEGMIGVIACDSKKSFAFSKLQGKLIEDLANEVSNTTELILRAPLSNDGKNSWPKFIAASEELLLSLSRSSIDVMRIKPLNFYEVEESLGTGNAVQSIEQIFRLLDQSLPPHFPSFRLPNGDMLVVLDNMMTTFYENKVRAISEHLSRDGCTFDFEFIHRNFRSRENRRASLEALLRATRSNPNGLDNVSGVDYEYRRA